MYKSFGIPVANYDSNSISMINGYFHLSGFCISYHILTEVTSEMQRRQGPKKTLA
jgi:hypothetical protein